MSTDLSPLADSLAAVYGRQHWGSQWCLYMLVRHWPELAGNLFAEQSMPAYFRKNDLWVHVRNSLWMQQMQLNKVDLLAKINAFLKSRWSVADLRWNLQPADLIFPAEKKYVPPPTNVDPAAEREFVSMANNVPDPEAREALCRLWRRFETIKRVGQKLK